MVAPVLRGAGRLPLGVDSRRSATLAGGGVNRRRVQHSLGSRRASGPVTRTMATTVRPFEFATAGRTVFGVGTFEERAGALLLELANREGVDLARQPLLVVAGSSGRMVEDLCDLVRAAAGSIPIPDPVVYLCPEGEPTVASCRECTALASQAGCGLVVAVGGGTAIDTAKAVAALITNGGHERDIYDFLEVVGRAMPLERRPCPFVAIPTTSGPGAELTKNAVICAGDVKVSMRNPLMLPDLVLCDPALTLTMPRSVTAHTGLDALTQCIEPYVCNQSNPVTDVLSLAGIKCGARSLRKAIEDPSDVAARTDMALCAMYGGQALANAKLGAVHGFAGILGGALDNAPHGALCAALLPHCIETNVKVLETRVMQTDPALAEEGLRRYADVAAACLGSKGASVGNLVAWAIELVAFCGVPQLRSFGLADADVAEITLKSMASSSMKGNPVQLTQDELEAMLRAAM